DESFVPAARDAPVLVEPQHAAVVEPPVLPAFPAFGLADHPYHRSERRPGVLGLGEAAVDPVLQGEQLVGAAGLRDLLDDSAITSKAPLAVEHRVAARAEIADRAVRAHATVFVIEERLARIHLRLERGAFRRVDLDSRQLPAC